jgi:hypothetical protein
MPRIPATALTVLFFLGAAGCNAPPCPDCEEPADVGDADGDGDGDGDEPLPDLPCGGADLMTDNLNCGTCGHECGVWYEGTEYQAGACEQDECSRSGWFGCVGARRIRRSPPYDAPGSTAPIALSRRTQ